MNIEQPETTQFDVFSLPATLNTQVIQIPCAECGCQFCPSITKTRICPTCLSKKNDISEGLPRNLIIHWCRYCHRFYGHTWILCERESKELLSICLNKITGLKKLKLIDANFIYTEEHAKRIKVRITVQKEVNATILLQQTIDVEFYEVYTQCDDCKKEFTPHTWKACVQVRQKVDNKKTFFYIEQLILKHSAHKKSIKINAVRDGMDFFFSSKPHALKFMDFLYGVVPHTTKESKELISHDTKSNKFNYKYTFYFEMPKICKDDIVILPKKLCNQFGGVNSLCICYKVTSKIHLFDPVSLSRFDMNSVQYFNYENDIKIIPFKGNSSEFYVTDLYYDKEVKHTFNQSFNNIEIRFAHVSLQNNNSNKEYTATTHLGHILNHGDSCLGFDLHALNLIEELSNIPNQKYLPEVIIIRKIYNQKQRIWKLKRIEMEEEEIDPRDKNAKKIEEGKINDMNDFREEIEQDKTLRSKIKLYKNEEVLQK